MWMQCHWVVNYLDDVIGVSHPADTSDAFQMLHNVLEVLGLPINLNKVEEPSCEITCLDINKYEKRNFNRHGSIALSSDCLRTLTGLV